MAVEIIMPKAGMDMKEGVILKWLVQVGEPVKEGEPLLEIETDKVTMEVEAPASGVLLCRYFEAGAVVPVVTVVGYIGAAGEAPPAAPAGIPSISASPVSAVENPAPGEYHVAVIGGGPAGYVAAIRAAQLGGRVVLFEQDALGGTCLNRGCIPAKTYLKTAECLNQIKTACERGIVLDAKSAAVDMEKVYLHKQSVVSKLTQGVAGLLKKNGVEAVKGRAKLADENTVDCGGTLYRARKVILCGGSKTGSIPIPGADSRNLLGSDGILELRSLPKKLAVIGGGVIGCEMAGAFCAFGSEVTVLELTDRLVPVMDREISAFMKTEMEKAGVRVLLNVQAEKIEDLKSATVVHTAGGQKFEADKVLLSVGRIANLDCLGNLAGKFSLDRGKLAVDDYCQTSIPGIYACGDMTSVSTLAHSAMKMGEVAAANAMGQKEKAGLSSTPVCVYTIPEAAGIGLSEEDALKTGEVMTGRFPFSANGRALASGESEGFVKVIAGKQYGEILGVHIAGPTATEMIAQAKILMDMEITVYEAAEIMYAHPGYSEAFMEACKDALGKCVHY